MKKNIILGVVLVSVAALITWLIKGGYETIDRYVYSKLDHRLWQITGSGAIFIGIVYGLISFFKKRKNNKITEGFNTQKFKESINPTVSENNSDDWKKIQVTSDQILAARKKKEPVNTTTTTVNEKVVTKQKPKKQKSLWKQLVRFLFGKILVRNLKRAQARWGNELDEIRIQKEQLKQQKEELKKNPEKHEAEPDVLGTTTSIVEEVAESYPIQSAIPTEETVVLQPQKFIITLNTGHSAVDEPKKTIPTPEVVLAVEDDTSKKQPDSASTIVTTIEKTIKEEPVNEAVPLPKVAKVIPLEKKSTGSKLWIAASVILLICSLFLVYFANRTDMWSSIFTKKGTDSTQIKPVSPEIKKEKEVKPKDNPVINYVTLIKVEFKKPLISVTIPSSSSVKKEEVKVDKEPEKNKETVKKVDEKPAVAPIKEKPTAVKQDFSKPPPRKATKQDFTKPPPKKEGGGYQDFSKPPPRKEGRQDFTKPPPRPSIEKENEDD